MKTLNELCKELFGKKINDKFIGIYNPPSQNEGQEIYPDYMDEMLETYGDEIVKQYKYIKEKKCLIVTLEDK